MIPLTRLKKDVLFNTELTKVVDVLKGIAAARFHVLERQLALFEPYAKAAETILGAAALDQVDHPFVRPRGQRAGVVMVTSDAGFLGGLNSQVVTLGLREGGAGALLTVIGERGVNYLRDLRHECTAFPGIQDTSRFSLAVAVRDHVVQGVLRGECGRLVIVYPKPLSFAVQEVTVETLLPCSEWSHHLSGPPTAGPIGEQHTVGLPLAAQRQVVGEMLWESRVDDVVEYVVAQRLGHRLEEIFALSRLAELAARAVHLEGSYQELVRRGKKLRQEYFRARHEIIDRSMREIFAAQLLYKGSSAVES
ncbi:MAG: F0F1 ATP synthase subunit gamma [Candidatus Omnitrophica bacterium]|nr:F0F1 ATP synthase subunit gamma [Candidatus Omnitrophota bacterium]